MVSVYIVAAVLAQFVGVSSFAALSPSFPCEAFLATSDFSRRPAMTVLYGTFGDDWSCVSRFIDRYRDKPHLLQVHFSNETCRRNRNCRSGEMRGDLSVAQYSRAIEGGDPAILREIRDRIRDIRAVVEILRGRETYLVLSAGLEDDYTPGAFSRLVRELEKEWPYLIVRSGSKFSTFPRERHGLGARCEGSVLVANVDGAVAGYFTQRKFALANKDDCLATFLWDKDHQGRGRRNSSKVDPKLRVFEWTPEDVVSYGAILEEATR